MGASTPASIGASMPASIVDGTSNVSTGLLVPAPMNVSNVPRNISAPPASRPTTAMRAGPNGKVSIASAWPRFDATQVTGCVPSTRYDGSPDTLEVDAVLGVPPMVKVTVWLVTGGAAVVQVMPAQRSTKKNRPVIGRAHLSGVMLTSVSTVVPGVTLPSSAAVAGVVTSDCPAESSGVTATA